MKRLAVLLVMACSLGLNTGFAWAKPAPHDIVWRNHEMARLVSHLEATVADCAGQAYVLADAYHAYEIGEDSANDVFSVAQEGDQMCQHAYETLVREYNVTDPNGLFFMPYVAKPLNHYRLTGLPIRTWYYAVSSATSAMEYLPMYGITNYNPYAVKSILNNALDGINQAYLVDAHVKKEWGIH